MMLLAGGTGGAALQLRLVQGGRGEEGVNEGRVGGLRGGGCLCRGPGGPELSQWMHTDANTHARTCAHSAPSCDRCHAVAARLRQWF